MRGSLLDGGTRHPNLGIIPAHAGLTSLQKMPAIPARDHPRACGAHCRQGMSERRAEGSSPRMRGSLKRRELDVNENRIIPAHAGLTSRMHAPSFFDGDHPRACGAHAVKIAFIAGNQGSSPRMRGSLMRHLSIS